jgi:hypothetical protein
MEAPTLIYAATGLLAIIALPSVARFAQLFKRIQRKETDNSDGMRGTARTLILEPERQ